MVITFFPQFIDKFRNKKGGMLEIGIFNYASLNLWLKYFTEFQIYGIDIAFEDKGERYEIFTPMKI